MATYTKQVSHEGTLSAGVVDTVTLTGTTSTAVTYSTADPPYVSAQPPGTGAVSGFVYRNRSSSQQSVTWGTVSAPPDPDTATPVDGQVVLDAGDVLDQDIHGGADTVIVKARAAAGGAYELVAKLP
jgi:hypothetical protein